MSTKPIRTNADLMKAVFKRGVESIPKIEGGGALGELAEHVRTSTLDAVAEEETLADPGDVIVTGETVSEAG